MASMSLFNLTLVFGVVYSATKNVTLLGEYYVIFPGRSKLILPKEQFYAQHTVDAIESFIFSLAGKPVPYTEALQLIVSTLKVQKIHKLALHALRAYCKFKVEELCIVVIFHARFIKKFEYKEVTGNGAHTP